MNHPEAVSNTELDQIEKEIREIDQMIYSWSRGKTLRFDPAHVQPVEESGLDVWEPSTDIRKVSRVFFVFNLLALVIPIGLLALNYLASLQTLEWSVPTAAQLSILTVSIMILAGGNLWLTAFYGAENESTKESRSVGTRSGRNQTARKTRI